MSVLFLCESVANNPYSYKPLPKLESNPIFCK